MEPRLDTPFSSWGGFSTQASSELPLRGRVSYEPIKGLELELLENPTRSSSSHAPPMDFFGQLVDGTLLTLTGCFATQSHFGAGVGAPTTFAANRAIFGGHIRDIENLSLKKYSMELSSLANWTCNSPLTFPQSGQKGDPLAFDMSYRNPEIIRVQMPGAAFDLEICQGIHHSGYSSNQFSIGCPAYLSLVAHEGTPFENLHSFAWQAQNLMALLFGVRPSIRFIELEPTEADAGGRPISLPLLYNLRDKEDHADILNEFMLLPYAMVKDIFSTMVTRWFSRSEQAVLATDVFFGSQYHVSPPLNVKFLEIMQAVESYHRSLNAGLYMDQEAFNEAIKELVRALPEAIRDADHRESLKNRLKYGNEHSLRKRLADMLDRLPHDLRQAIAADEGKFIRRAVDTRNFYTHYDHKAQENSFQGRELFFATERLRVLVVAHLLHDLGVGDNILLGVLQRNREFSQLLDGSLDP